MLPRPEGLPFVKDAKTLAFIYARARNRYREGMPVLGKDVGAKVRELIDEHVISLGIDPKIPPISITDAEFAEHVAKAGVTPRQGVRDGARDPAPHPQAPRPGPGPLHEAVGAAGRDPQASSARTGINSRWR